MADVRLSDLRAGDTIELDGGFSCMPAGKVRVEAAPDDEEAWLYFRCARGKHLLRANEKEPGGPLEGVISHTTVIAGGGNAGE